MVDFGMPAPLSEAAGKRKRRGIIIGNQAIDRSHTASLTITGYPGCFLITRAHAEDETGSRQLLIILV